MCQNEYPEMMEHPRTMGQPEQQTTVFDDSRSEMTEVRKEETQTVKECIEQAERTLFNIQEMITSKDFPDKIKEKHKGVVKCAMDRLFSAQLKLKLKNISD